MIKYIQTKLNQGHIAPPFPQWGTIGKGTKVEKQGKSYPAETPHFNFNIRAGLEFLSSSIHQLYGEKPMQFEALIYPQTNSSSVTEALIPSSMQVWAGSKFDPAKRTLMTECDGETVLRKFDSQTKQYIKGIDCGFDHKTRQCSHGCKPTCKLVLILPELCKMVGQIGYFTMTLHSWGDILSITKTINHVGNEAGACLWRFLRQQATARYIDDNGAHERKHYPVKIVLVRGGLFLNEMLQAPIANAQMLVSGELNDEGEQHSITSLSVTDVDSELPIETDVNHGSHAQASSPRTGTESDNEHLINMVCDYLLSKYNISTTKTDVLSVLGYRNTQELIDNWDAERTVGAVAERFVLKINDMEF